MNTPTRHDIQKVIKKHTCISPSHLLSSSNYQSSVSAAYSFVDRMASFPGQQRVVEPAHNNSKLHKAVLATSVCLQIHRPSLNVGNCRANCAHELLESNTAFQISNMGLQIWYESDR